MRHLEQGVQVPVELTLDDNGHLDRGCPSVECRTHFKVHFEDWRDIVRDEVVFCPICRHDAEAGEWNTPEQAEYIQQLAIAHIQKELGQALRADAQRLERPRHSDSFITMSMSYATVRISVPVPATAADIMTQHFACEQCKCRYSSIGAAFFCPSCGHNSVLHTFTNALETVRKTLEAIPSFRAALIEMADANIAEDSIRHICENGLVKLVSSFQRYAEACFQQLANAPSCPLRRNLFQNLQESDVVWRNASGAGYADLLDSCEYVRLAMYFQQRHVLSHLDGIVDNQYIARSGDRRFDVGQRLVVTDATVADLADLIDKLAAGLLGLT